MMFVLGFSISLSIVGFEMRAFHIWG